MAIIIEPKFDPHKLEDYQGLGQQLDHLRAISGAQIVFTAGVWDLLHEGHIRYLRRAKAEGNILVVGVDSDEWTRARKGPDRPLVTQSERLEILWELRSVDYLVLITGTESYDECLRAIRPDTLVLSMTTSDLPEERRAEFLKYCKSIKIFEPQAVVSTTSRLRNLLLGGKKDFSQDLLAAVNAVVEKHLGGDAAS